MDVLKIQSEIEEHIKELKRIAKENDVSIGINASPYIYSKDATSITKVEISGDKNIEEILHQEESDELNMVFTYRKLIIKEEKEEALEVEA